MSKPVTEAAAETAPSPAAVRAALETVLSSAGFRKSERQAKFLRFVCEAVLAGEGPKLHEFMIAQAVFGRGEQYSSTEDSVVRRQAYSVRQKLRNYYAEEGKSDPVRIALPVGRYIPVFTLAAFEGATAVPPEAGAESPPVIPPQPEERPERTYPPSGPRRLALMAILLVIAAFGAGWRVARTAPPAPAGVDPALAAIWGEWLNPRQPIILCFSNPLLAQIFDVQEPLSDDILPHLMAVTPEQAKTLRSQLTLPADRYLYLLPLPGTNAKMGEALGSVPMAAFFTRAAVPVQATQSRLLSWEDFRAENLILLGHTESNKWLDPILSTLPLRLGPWQADKPTRVINVNPGPGEPSEFDADGRTTNNGRKEAYALVSMIEGLDGRHQLALINGLSTEGTQIAEELLTDPVSARKLLGTLRNADPRHAGPWHFQLLLRAEVHANLPTVADLVTVRILGSTSHRL